MGGGGGEEGQRGGWKKIKGSHGMAWIVRKFTLGRGLLGESVGGQTLISGGGHGPPGPLVQPPLPSIVLVVLRKGAHLDTRAVPIYMYLCKIASNAAGVPTLFLMLMKLCCGE